MQRIFSLFLLPVVLIKFLLKPIIDINFAKFAVSELGHMNEDTIVSLRANSIRKKSIFRINIFYYDGKAQKCNEYLFKMWARVLNVVQKNFFLEKIIQLEKKVFFNKIENRFYFYNKAVRNFKNPLYFTDHEKKIALKKLYDLGLKKNQKWICIGNRENDYYNFKFQKKPKYKLKKRDINYNAYRNFDINIFNNPIKRFLNKGYFIFRVGKYTKSQINLKDKNYFDLSKENSFENDLLQIFLLANCKLTICPSNGMTSIPQLFDRNLSTLNNPDILYRYMYQFWIKMPFLPKLIFEKNNNKLVKLKDYSKFGLIHSEKTFPPFHVNTTNFKFKNNTLDEVENLFKEIIDIKFENKKYSKEEVQLQRHFLKIIKKNLEKKYHKNLTLRIGMPGIYFLKKYSKFLL